MAKEPIYISVTFSPFGALILSTIHAGHRIERTYYDYSLTVAKKLFKQHLKTLG